VVVASRERPSPAWKKNLTAAKLSKEMQRKAARLAQFGLRFVLATVQSQRLHRTLFSPLGRMLLPKKQVADFWVV
jgi:hypothetical protein